MPNLPERYTSQVAAQANRRVIDQPTFAADTSMGDAIQNVGRVGLEIASRIQKAKTDQEIVKAEIDARTRLDRLKLDLEADAETPDEAIPVRWRQESEAILKEAAGAISSESARNLWSDRAKGWQGEGENWSVGLQRRRQVGRLRADYLGMAAEAETLAGDKSISADAYALRLDAMRALNAQQAAGGIVDPETSAKREADLAAMAGKDRALRWNAEVGALADQGQFDAANALVAEGDKAGIPKAYVEDAKSSISRAKNRIEKERNERMNVNDANFQVDVMAGKKGYSHIDEGIARGDLDPARKDTLYRVVREEEDRQKREAERSKLSASEKAEAEEKSKDARFMLDAFALTNESMFLKGYDAWPLPYQKTFDAMTEDSQRAVLLKTLEQPKGDRASAAKETVNALLDEAKRVVPEWRLGSDADPEKLPKDAIPFRGELQKVAERIAKENDGKPLTVEQARDAVARALRAYQPDKWMGLPTNQRDAYLENPGAAPFQTGPNTYAKDGGARFTYDEGANIRNEIANDFLRLKGRRPTKAELEAEYARVAGD